MVPKSMRPVAERWRKDLNASLEWKKDPGREPKQGEAKGFFVNAEGFQHAAYLKPGQRKKDGICRAAHEKIVSDLGHDLGLPIAPVLLYERQDCPENEEPHACVSLLLYDEHYPWGQAFDVSEPVLLMLVQKDLAATSGIVALDTWVANRDRKNANNALYGVSPDRGEQGWVFIDHAYTLSRGKDWGKDTPPAVPPFPDVLLGSIDSEILADYVAEIEGLEDDVITDIVQRIPQHYLPDKEKTIIEEGLKERRSRIRPVLGQTFGF